MSAPTTLARFRDAHAAALRGETGLARACLARTTDASPVEAAWALALRALVDPMLAVSPREVTALMAADVDARDPCARLALTLGVRAARRLAASDVGVWTPVLESAAGSYGQAGAAVLRALTAWLAGEAGPATPELENARTLCRGEGHAELVVELECARALLELGAGQWSEGRARARTAVRMAQAEQLPAQELVAHMALARVRRHEGQPHLAARILHSVSRYVPREARDWLHWEQGMLGVRRGPATALGALLDALFDDRDVAAALDALERAALPAPLRNDANRVLALIARRGPAVTEQTPWRTGAVNVSPPGLAGLWLHTPDPNRDAAPVTALVLVGPGVAPARVPVLAARFEAARHRADSSLLGAPWHPRTETGLAVLAWQAARPVSQEAYFQSVFGIRYEAALHASMLATHLMRVRERVGDAASVERTNEGLVFRPDRTVLLRDPTCAEVLEQQALRLIGAAGGTSAADLARALAVPLRTAQRLLQALVADGVALTTKEGRNVVYDVEDSVFAESTLARMLSGLSGGAPDGAV